MLEVAVFFAMLLAGAAWIGRGIRSEAFPVAAVPVALLVASMAARATVRWGNVSLLRTLPEVTLLAAAGFGALWTLSRHTRRPSAEPALIAFPALVAFGLFATLSIPGWIQATDTAGTATWWVRLVVALLVLGGARIQLSIEERHRVLASAALWLLIAVVVAVLAAPDTNIGTQTELPFFDVKSRLPAVNSRDLGWLGFGLAAWGVAGPSRRRWLWAAVGALVIVAAQHRVGILQLLMLAGLSLPALSVRVRAAVACVVVAGTAVLAIPTPWSPFYGGGSASNVLSSRRAMWREGINQWDQAPWFGRGMNSVVEHQIRPLLERDYEQLRQLHNTWLDVLLGSGIVATAALIIAAAALASLVWKHPAGVARRLAMAVLLGAGLESLLGPSLDRGAWILLAVLLVVPNKRGAAVQE